MRARSLAGIGSVVSAVASSACCWLPLLMVAFGFSAAGAAAFFERFRLLFLVLAGALLLVGYYLNYRTPRKECGPDGKCLVPNRKLQRWNRGMLWFSTALVLAFAFFPNYVGTLIGASEISAATQDEETETLVIGIQGMTCAGCEAAVGTALSEVSGVLASNVSYEKGTAEVTVDRSNPPSQFALNAAVGKAGYEATGTQTARPALSGQWRAELDIDEEEKAELIVDLGTVGSRWAGEFDLPKFGVENYPIEVSSSGESIELYFTAIGMGFKGTLSDDGQSLSGTGKSEGEEEPIELRRVAPEPQFSEGFLALEAAADDPSLVETLSANGAELRIRFNADNEKTRLLMLLSPT